MSIELFEVRKIEPNFRCSIQVRYSQNIFFLKMNWTELEQKIWNSMTNPNSKIIQTIKKCTNSKKVTLLENIKIIIIFKLILIIVIQYL